MKKSAILLALGAILALVPPEQAANAQMPANALGQVREDGQLAPGTVTVTVIAGNMQTRAIGIEVTMLVNGKPQQARTDPQGHATFAGLPVGAKVQAKVKGADDKDVESTEFVVSANAGMRTLLSTKPFTGAEGQGAMDPRKASGRTRPDKDVPAGTLVLTVGYADGLKVVNGRMQNENPPVGETVSLVGYTAGDEITVTSQKVTADGHVTFTDLDPSGSTAYYALTAMPRNGGFDRLSSAPILLDGQIGEKGILAGEGLKSTADFVDNYDHSKVKPGQIRVFLDGQPDPTQPVTVYEAGTHRVIGKGVAQMGPADGGDTESASQFTSGGAAGHLEVQLAGGGDPKTNVPVPDIDVRIVPADKLDAPGVSGKTAKDGWFQLDGIPTDGPQVALYKVNGKDFKSDPFDVSKAGGKLDVVVRWGFTRLPEITIDAPAEPVVAYAETVATGIAGTYRSRPFLTIPTQGVTVPIVVYTRVFFTFELQGESEDELLGVHGTLTVNNTSWAPYREEEGVLVKAPRGHKGGVLAPNDQAAVAVVPGEGFRVLRPIPPGGKSFIAGFSLPVERGTVDWSWDLPLGAWQSVLAIRQTPGMLVHVPQSAKMTTERQAGATWNIIRGINIRRGQSLQMSINNLPAPPAWKLWVPRFAALVVIGTMITGIGFALSRRRKVSAVSAARVKRAALLDELVELERTGGSPERREQVMAELERIWSTPAS